MKKKAAQAKFRIGIDVFYTAMKPKLSFMRRDKDEFAAYGLTEEDINSLEEQLESFASIPTDDELLGLQISATQAKDEAAELLRQKINAILTRAANKFGTNSGHYRKFGVKALSRMDNGELSTCARRVHRIASAMLNELASEGLTAEIVEDLKQHLHTYDDLLGQQEDMIADRDIATENRMEIANGLYAIMAKYCNTGKRIWEGKNEAKYNDYIIYDTPSGTAEEEIKEAS